METTNHNLFLTGKAGTGKSTLLEIYRQKSKKRFAILAPTGVSAINVKGETIHAFFGLKPGQELDEVINNFHTKRPKFFQKLETIIIDEISMVRADLLDAINIFLKKARNTQEPFGGIQMIFIGDLYQLPPVLTPQDREVFQERYDCPFFFGAKVITEEAFDLQKIELQKIYRQDEQEFIGLLNAVRKKEINYDQLAALNQRVAATFEEKKHIYLVTTNRKASEINSAHLEELPDDPYTFEAQIHGEVQNNQHPTDTLLTLKAGAQIIFIQNDPKRHWVNGTIGTIKTVDPDFELLEIETDQGDTVTVMPHTWEISKYVFKEGKFQREAIGSFRQFPIRLAWAITIHKSQGKTFEHTIVDLGSGSFAHGQTYVALSRCRKFNGLSLARPLRTSDIKLDPRVKQFLT